MSIVMKTHCVGMFYICCGYFRVISIAKVLYSMDTITVLSGSLFNHLQVFVRMETSG